jgi:hypothetical protein
MLSADTIAFQATGDLAKTMAHGPAGAQHNFCLCGVQNVHEVAHALVIKYHFVQVIGMCETLIGLFLC